MTDSIIENTQHNECFVCYEEEHQESPINLRYFHVIRDCECNGHIHPTCYATWLQHNWSCPICRMPIRLNQNFSPENSENLPQNMAYITFSYSLRFRELPRWVRILIYLLLFLLIFFTIFLIFHAF